MDFAPFAMPLPFPSLKDADTAKMELTPVLPLVTKANNCVELVVKLVALLRIWFRNKDSSKLNCCNFFRLETNFQNQSQITSVCISMITSFNCNYHGMYLDSRINEKKSKKVFVEERI